MGRVYVGLLVTSGIFAWFFAVGARAEEPVSSPPRHLQCRTFQGPTDREWIIVTSDGTTEVGQWVGEQAALGWQVEAVDFEVGTKPTGYPSTWASVCLVRQR